MKKKKKVFRKLSSANQCPFPDGYGYSYVLKKKIKKGVTVQEEAEEQLDFLYVQSVE